MPPPLDDVTARRQRIIAALRGRGLEQAAADPRLRADLEAEAAAPEPDRLVHPDLLRVVDEARAVCLRQPALGLFFSTDDVIIVPGLMGSELVDLTGGIGLIWIDPRLVFSADELLALRLAGFAPGRPDTDATPGVTVRPNGAVPLIYGGLKYDLEVRRYDVRIFGFDWRKGFDEAAEALAAVVRDRANHRFRPLHLVAHSQGSLVTRRALQLLGPDLARRLVSNLILLGPATAGTFSAAFAIAGSHSLIETVRRYGIEAPPGFPAVLQSMTGLYQLLPWRTEAVTGGPADNALRWVAEHLASGHPAAFNAPAFWESGVDEGRLRALYGAGRSIDAGFFNDRTTLILGDRETAGGVRFESGRLVEDPAYRTRGDGTVPDSFARVAGVTRVYRAAGAEHMMLPATLSVIAAVRDVLAGRSPRVEPAGFGAAADVPVLSAPPAEERVGPAAVATTASAAAPAVPAGDVGTTPATGPATPQEVLADISPPPHRRLRVFSFDPLFATELDALGVEQIGLELPWDFADGDHLKPGPVGEYLEVVDHDPATGCFYPPVDLNHPHVLAQGGLAPSEGDPRFHQQMVYAVAMTTIRHFEAALGRVALWGPRLVRDQWGEVVPLPRPEDEYIGRLRVYPHALRQANAYYHPDKKAILFGYFPAEGADVGRNLPGGTVFTCLSYDVVAHETTHALLDGLHRYFTEPSNPDVYAFHEAFADVVALFQHFSHPEVLRHQVARTRGDLQRENMLGVLAAQFGEAQGRRGALRQYLGRRGADGRWEPVRPDASIIGKAAEPHERGAILVAALFRGFINVYESRVQDLRRIATGGTGLLPEGDVHPDLVNRLADEAAKAARHLLTMCVRALDYVPPVDLTFGEYLRALITADYDLVRDDDRRYRLSVVAAFRDWGIYPSDVRSLSIDSLLWCPPERAAFRNLSDFFAGGGLPAWGLTTDRRAAYETMRAYNARFNDWLRQNVPAGRDQFLGLALGPDAPGGIRRNKNGHPVYEVHSFRPCRRIGPDGQERTDMVVEVVQRRKAFFDPAVQAEVDAGRLPDARPDFYLRGGCTLVIDPVAADVRYCVQKPIRTAGDGRLARERRFRQGQFGDKVGGAYLAPAAGGSPFAFLHAHS